MIILGSLNTIWSKLNENLLAKYLNKLKLFLKHQEPNLSPIDSSRLYTKIFQSIFKFARTEYEETHHIYAQVVQFFRFICTEFTIDPTQVNGIELLNRIADIIVLFDNNLYEEIFHMDRDDLDEMKFLMVFYIKCRLVVCQHQPIIIINGSIQILLENIE